MPVPRVVVQVLHGAGAPVSHQLGQPDRGVLHLAEDLGARDHHRSLLDYFLKETKQMQIEGITPMAFWKKQSKCKLRESLDGFLKETQQMQIDGITR